MVFMDIFVNIKVWNFPYAALKFNKAQLLRALTFRKAESINS